VIVPPEGYWQQVKQHCRARGMLLIFDEAQTAFRLGRNFAFQHFGVEPDILTLSKTLGGGIPLSAVVTSTEIEAECNAHGFLHATSHVSDPLPARVGLAVLDVIEEEELMARAIEMGERLAAGLRHLQERHEIIGDVRGLGLLWGVELVMDRERREPDAVIGRAITERCMELGLSMNIVAIGTMAAIWRIAPPLTVSAEEINRGIAILDQAIVDVLAASTSRAAE
jgi:2,2-dialkylglycine decarboxylase (pyruvate)